MEFVFVGRDDHLETLGKKFDDLLRGKGHTILISGEAGIGKTELVFQFKRKFIDRYNIRNQKNRKSKKSEILWSDAKCSPQTGKGDPYRPFLDALRGESARIESQSSRKRFSQILKEIGPDWLSTLPFAGSVIAASMRTVLALGADKKTETEEITTEQFYTQFIGLLREITAKYPLVLFLDDLHWSDDSSLDLFFYLSRSFSFNHPLLLIGTYRLTEVPEYKNEKVHPLREINFEAYRYPSYTVINLQHLDYNSLHLYLNKSFKPNVFSNEFTELLQETTNGSPFFMEEWLALLKAQGIIVRIDDVWRLTKEVSDIQVPDTITKVIEKRLALIHDEILLDTLRYASVEGERFTTRVLAQLLEEKELSLIKKLHILEKVHELIELLKEQGLLVQRGSTYQFRHFFTYKTVYDSLDPYERKLLHRQVAIILENLANETGIIKEAAPELAWHFEEAEEYLKSVDYRIIAAKRAQKLQAFSEMIGHSNKGIDDLSKTKIESQEYMPRKALLFNLRGIAEHIFGRWDEAIRDRKFAFDSYYGIKQSKEASDICRGIAVNYYRKGKLSETDTWLSKSLEIAVKANEEISIASTLQSYLRYLSTYHTKEKIESLFKFGLNSCKKDYTLARTIIMCNLGELYLKFGELDKARKAFKEFIIFERNRGKKLNDSWYLQQALEKLGNIYEIQGKWQKCLNLYTAVWKIKHRIKDLWGDAGLLNVIAATHLKMGNCMKALEEHERSLIIVRKVENIILYFQILSTGISIHLELADFEEALIKAEELYTKATDVGAISFRASSLKTIGMIYLYQDQFIKSQETLFKSLEIRQELKVQRFIGNYYFPIAKLYYKLKEFSKALDYINRALTLMEEDVFDLGPAYLLKCQIEISLNNHTSAFNFLQKARDLYSTKNLSFRLFQCDMVKGLLLWHESMQMINGKDMIHADKILDMQKEARKLIEEAIKYFHENRLGLLKMEAKELAEKINDKVE